MGRMPRSVAVVVVFDFSIFVFFNVGSSVLFVEVEPLAMTAWLDQSAVREAQVNLFFQKFRFVCFDPPKNGQRVRRPDMRGPKAEAQVIGRAADLAGFSVVKEIDAPRFH